MSTLRPLLTAAPLMLCANAVIAQDNHFTIHIPAQPLPAALERLAQQTGIKPFLVNDVAKGKNSRAVVGQYSAQEALMKLLEGTGLGYSFTSAASVVIKAAENGSSDATTLPTMKVVGAAEREDYDSTDPYNPHYNRANASTATKTDTPIMQTPFGIQVVPQQVIQDQQAVRMEKALENVSSVQPAAAMGAAYGLQSGTLIRGFLTQDYYRDGGRISTNQIADGFREMANIERVEVLKGPASILYGRMEPGGIINLVTKQPLAMPYHALSQQFGSFDFYRTTIDSTGSINQNDDLLYRVNLAYENSGSYRDFVDHERVFLAPTFHWTINDKTQANFHLEYQRSNNATDYGFFVMGDRPAPLPRSQSLSGPGGKLESERVSLGFDWSHAFNDNWKFSHRFDASILPMSNLTPQLIPAGTVEFWEGGTVCTVTSCLLERIPFKQSLTSENYYTTVNLTGKFDTWGIKHTVLVGGDYQRLNSRNTHAYSFQSPIIDAFNPDYSAIAATYTDDPNLVGRNGQDEDWVGFYTQDQIELPYHVHVLAGFRYDNATNTTWSEDIYNKNNNPLQPYTAVSNNEDAVNPRFGLLWQPVSELSFYGNYVENFGLSQGRNVDHTPLPPVTAQQFEAGIKTELFDKRFIGTLAWFNITKQNLAVPDTSSVAALQLGYYRAVGEVRNQGVELDLAGEVLPGWRIIGNYAYIDSKITKDADSSGGTGDQGNRLFNVPRNSASLWNTYEFQQAVLRGLKFGAGVVVRGQRTGNTANTFQLPGYATVNLMAGYSRQIGVTKLTTQLNINNLLDQFYYDSSNGITDYGVIPGAGTNLMGSVRLEF